MPACIFQKTSFKKLLYDLLKFRQDVFQNLCFTEEMKISLLSSQNVSTLFFSLNFTIFSHEIKNIFFTIHLTS